MTLGRRELLFGVLALTLIAAIWPLSDADRAGEAVSEPVKRAHGSATPAPPMPTLADLSQAPSGKDDPIVDLFPRQSWTPAPSAQTKAEPAAPPPLPFGFGGRYTDGSKTVVFLTEGTLVHTVGQGDTVKGVYRIDEIGVDSITLTYLPLGRQQKLPAPTPRR